MLKIRARNRRLALNGFDFFVQAIKLDEPEPPKRPARKVILAKRKAAKTVEPTLSGVAFLDEPEEVA